MMEMRVHRVAFGISFILAGLFLSGGEWNLFSRRSLPPFLAILATLALLNAFSLLLGGILLTLQGVLKRIPESTFRTLGRAASILFGLTLFSGGALIFVVGVTVIPRETDSPWAFIYMILGGVGVALGVMSCVRPRFASDWRPPELEPLEVNLQQLAPMNPPEPDLEGLLQVKKRLRDQGRI